MVVDVAVGRGHAVGRPDVGPDVAAMDVGIDREALTATELQAAQTRNAGRAAAVVRDRRRTNMPVALQIVDLVELEEDIVAAPIDILRNGLGDVDLRAGLREVRFRFSESWCWLCDWSSAWP